MSPAPGDPVPGGADMNSDALSVLDAVSARLLAERYLAICRASTGGRAERLVAEASADVVNEVIGRVLGEPDPFPLLDALVVLGNECSLAGDDELIERVGAGPVEDAIVERPDLRSRIAERCADAVPGWRETVQRAWADADVAATLPPPLDGLVFVLGDVADAHERPTGSTRRPSKRQGPRDRGRRR